MFVPFEEGEQYGLDAFGSKCKMDLWFHISGMSLLNANTLELILSL